MLALSLFIFAPCLAEASAFEADHVELPPNKMFEVRVIIWKAKDVVAMDTFEDMNDTYVRANIECFVSLLEALRASPAVPLIYASSSSVYGANTKTPFSESDRVDAPSSLYAATKKADEAFAHVYHGLYGLRVTGETTSPPPAA